MGVAGDPSAAGSSLNLGASFRNVSGGTASWSFNGGTNYNNQNGTVPIEIVALSLTGSFTADNKVYDANTSATVLSHSLSGVISPDVVSLTGGTATFADADAGNGKTVTLSGAGLSGADAGNYSLSGVGTTTANIDKADATVNVTGYSGTFDGNSHGASGSATGVGGLDLSGALSLGARFTNVPGGTANWTFAGGTNYNDQNGTAAIVIGKADATVTVNGYSGTYDASAHGASGTATGVLSEDLSAGLSLGSSFTDVPGGTANWSFNGGTNYNNQNGSVPIEFVALSLTGSFTADNKVYDANTSATVLSRSLNGVISPDDVSLTGGTATFADADAGNGKTVTLSGADLSGADAGNYSLSGVGTTTANIDKADASITVNGYTGVYDGAAHGASGSATGVGGADLSGALSLGATFTNVPGGTANWAFAGGTNYNDDAGNASIVISKADASITVNGYTGVYDATAHGATGTATGVGGADLSGALSLGATFTNVPGGTANWAFAGGTNYNDDNGSVAISISKADATVSVSGYSGTYDAAAHGASGTVVGVAGDLSATGSSLSLGSSFTNVPGGAANWTFTGGTNYNNQNSSVPIEIVALSLTGSFTANNKTYNGSTAATIATRSLTGVISGDDVNLSGGSATFDNANAGTGKTVTGTGFGLSGAKAGNYQLASTTLLTTADILKANAAISVTPYSVTYDANAHTATGSAIGAAGENLNSLLNLSGTTHTAAGSYSDTWTFAGNLNHFAASNTVTDNIGTGTLTVTAGNASKQYSDPMPAFSYSITGFASGEGVGNLVGAIAYSTAPATIFSGPGTYPITPSGFTSSNYTFTWVPGTLTVTQEDARATYTGALFASTASSTSGAATVTLSATIQDISAVTGDPAYDAYAGDIHNATVTFFGDGAELATVPVGLVSSSDTRTGTATYNWSVNIGNADAVSYTIGIKVNNYYGRYSSSDDGVVTVAKPLNDFITGGSYLVLSKSSGLKAGGVGTKNNFGFNVKYNKSNKSLQGNINTIIRNAGKVYQIKGNSMTSLSVKTGSPASAVFNGKASIQDITNPLSAIAIDGNATLQVTMTDAGEPGSSDKIAITVWNKAGGLWFASNWNGVKTVEQLLAGGNLQVRATASYVAESFSSEDVVIPTEFKIYQNFPNPFNPTTTVAFDIPEPSDVALTIFDLLGRKVQTLVKAQFEPGSYRQQWDSRDETGSALPSGVYLLRIYAKSTTSDRELIAIKKMVLLK